MRSRSHRTERPLRPGAATPRCGSGRPPPANRCAFCPCLRLSALSRSHQMVSQSRWPAPQASCGFAQHLAEPPTEGSPGTVVTSHLWPFRPMGSTSPLAARTRQPGSGTARRPVWPERSTAATGPSGALRSLLTDRRLLPPVRTTANPRAKSYCGAFRMASKRKGSAVSQSPFSRLRIPETGKRWPLAWSKPIVLKAVWHCGMCRPGRAWRCLRRIRILCGV